MPRYIATVTTGLESTGAEELQSSFGIAATGTLPGAVVFDGPEVPSAEAIGILDGINRWSRGLDRVGVLLAAGPAATLDDCHEHAASIDYAPLLDADQSFAVRPARRGEHEFRSPDVGRVVGQAVIDAFQRLAGARLAVSLREPDVVIRAELIDDHFRLWIDATGDVPLYRRGYRRQLHPASLRASLAHSLLRLAKWGGEPLLDPMAGIGTIPIEAGMYAAGRCPSRQRRTGFAFEKWCRLHATAGSVGAATLRPAAPIDGGGLPIDPAALDILGVELYPRHVDGALLNMAAAGVPPGVSIEQGDARRIDRDLPAGRFRLAVVNPPFGRRVGSTAHLVELYESFAASAARLEIGRIVALAERYELVAGSLSAAGYRVVRHLDVLYGDLPAHVIIAELEP